VSGKFQSSFSEKSSLMKFLEIDILKKKAWYDSEYLPDAESEFLLDQFIGLLTKFREKCVCSEKNERRSRESDQGPVSAEEAGKNLVGARHR